MAHAARLEALAGDLVEAVTGLSPQRHPKRLHSVRDVVLRNLRTHQFLSTNPFQVVGTLDGLQERFRVNHRDELADALRDRLGALEESPAPWHHDILALFLELSDQPTFYSKLSDLDKIKLDRGPEAPPLRWEDIAREDGWDGDELIWQPVNYSDGSGDEVFIDDGDDDDDDGGDPSDVSDGLSLFDEQLDGSRGATTQDCIIHPEDTDLLDSLRKEHGWRVASPPVDDVGVVRRITVTEPHVVREILFMLQGLDTTLFSSTGLPLPAFEMEHVSWEIYKAAIRTIAESGRRVSLLRRFVEHPQPIMHLQAFQDCIANRLQAFDGKISEIQARFATPKDEPLFSILAVHGEMTPWIDPLLVLSNIIAQLQEAPGSDTFRYLELLFDETTMSQFKGDLPIYEFLAKIFIECFHAYLRPIRRWMDEGRLMPGNDMFFVYESSDEPPLSKIWQERFLLLKSRDGKLRAPRFLSPAVQQIYNAGKNIVVLRQLGRFDSSNAENIEEPPLDFDTVCPKGSELATFPGLFGAAFDRWIQSKYRKTSTTLKDLLLEECGLSVTLGALQALYLMSEGFAASSFSGYLFDKLESRNPVWYDRFALTGAGQDAYASLLDANRLSIRIRTEGQHVTVEEAQNSVRVALPHVKIDYRLAWPVSMVISEQSMGCYQSMFVFLLQLKRAVYALHKPRILDYYWTDPENWDDRALFYSSRKNLVWFCTTLQTYLSTLVLAPAQLAMQKELREAADVDAMIDIHTSYLKQIIDQGCIGSRLTTVRECILEMFNLAITLENAREAKEAADVALQGPFGFPEPKIDGGDNDDDGDGDGDDDGRRELEKEQADEVYFRVLAVVRADFDQHLRFICQGLRSVARATGDSTSAKWDILADMLQGGRDDR
ncbi:Gamma-tubulin complex component 5 [Escovopsis weberi]|uniref:Spindle pole body component n=1 Tax=Escovopsis weberi TaxID=150374 RepID=A0A0M8N2Z7_ESCWE|nr:Gamma-tubulin complex component 5 [Escovopsis weberi]